MKKIILGFLITASVLMADVQHIWASKSFVNRDIKIVDIRTPDEWKHTGIVKGSYTIMFFDERGNYNIPLFLKKLNKVVNRGEQFAIICRTGSRTGMIAPFLSDKVGHRVINIKGGIMKLMHEGYKPVSYRK